MTTQNQSEHSRREIKSMWRITPCHMRNEFRICKEGHWATIMPGASIKKYVVTWIKLGPDQGIKYEESTENSEHLGTLISRIRSTTFAQITLLASGPTTASINTPSKTIESTTIPRRSSQPHHQSDHYEPGKFWIKKGKGVITCNVFLVWLKCNYILRGI